VAARRLPSCLARSCRWDCGLPSSPIVSARNAAPSLPHTYTPRVTSARRRVAHAKGSSTFGPRRAWLAVRRHALA
jgi:hypothetical protein